MMKVVPYIFSLQSSARVQEKKKNRKEIFQGPLSGFASLYDTVLSAEVTVKDDKRFLSVLTACSLLSIAASLLSIVASHLSNGVVN